MKTPRNRLFRKISLLMLFAVSPTCAQVPVILKYQGRIAVSGTAPDGPRKFLFALVNAAGTDTLWSNDGTVGGEAEPSTPVEIPVSCGYFSIPLGDTNVPGLTQAIAPGLFRENAEIFI